MAKVLGIRAELRLDSRGENQIANETSREPPRAGDELAVAAYKRDYWQAIHRTEVSSRKYNCHGLSFASRRTVIHLPEEVAKILLEDEYQRVELDDVKPGDLAIYNKGGDLEHSGIVIEFNPILKISKILGKWGFCQEVVHWSNYSPYAGEIQYYRIES